MLLSQNLHNCVILKNVICTRTNNILNAYHVLNIIIEYVCPYVAMWHINLISEYIYIYIWYVSTYLAMYT
jgi:hypothetical protein